MVPKEQLMAKQSSAFIPKEFVPFKSPVDGSIINDRGQLARHNKRHGVTDNRDYGPKWFKQKEKERQAETLGQTKTAQRERIELIKHTIHNFERRR